MRKLIIAATAVAVVLSAANAFAKDVNGTIMSINAKADTITLTNGQIVHLPEGVEAETLKAGERVAITYSTNAAGKTVVTGIRPIR
jgi:hypothetical protein